MRYPTKSVVAATPVVIPGVPERRVRIHKVFSGGANTIADSTGTLWSGGATGDVFQEPLRSQKAGDPVTVTGTGTVSVQFSYEGA